MVVFLKKETLKTFYFAFSEHNVYTTTYSSSRLTNHAFATRCEGKDCLERFDPDSTAFLEIYYEQMSYEVLSEREAYSFVNFLSDVGGQAVSF